MGRIPAVFAREDVLVDLLAARFDLQRLDGFAPAVVVRRGAVLFGVGLRAVDFHQRKARRVVALLEHVEARDARLPGGVARIVERGRLEGFDLVGFDVGENVNDVHGRSFFCGDDGWVYCRGKWVGGQALKSRSRFYRYRA